MPARSSCPTVRSRRRELSTSSGPAFRGTASGGGETIPPPGSEIRSNRCDIAGKAGKNQGGRHESTSSSKQRDGFGAVPDVAADVAQPQPALRTRPPAGPDSASGVRDGRALCVAMKAWRPGKFCLAKQRSQVGSSYAVDLLLTLSESPPQPKRRTRS